MMKLWQKDFNVNKDIEDFTIDKDKEYDLYLAPYDVLGSLAHAMMLKEAGIIDQEELDSVVKGLKEIFKQVTGDGFRIGDGIEDIHSQVEILLTEKTGDAGKKIHTGRSRNDQVLLDIRLYVRNAILKTAVSAGELSQLLLDLSEKNKDVFMPGYTHLQAAMPSSFGLWFGAYAESLTEDIDLLKSAFDNLNRNPLGSAAGYGSSFPLKRNITTELLGFTGMNVNSIAAQMGRGKTERLLSLVLAQLADTIGRMAAEICLYMGQDFGFFSFPDELTTGSSIMPHKKNPDVFELIRGKCNQVKAIPAEMMLITGNLPSGYHRDYQLMKGRIIDAINLVDQCLEMMKFMLLNVSVNRELKSADKYKFLYSVELINRYVQEGMPFRDAYKKVSELIATGKFEIPGHPEYTHEGSIGNLMNDEIRIRLMNALKYIDKSASEINEKFDRLLK